MNTNTTYAALPEPSVYANLRSNERMIRIAIVDDKAGNRNSLAEKMGQLPDFEVCFTAADGAEFLNEMAARPAARQPLVVLMDLDMPVMNGIEAISRAHELYPDVHFLVLTVFDEDDKIFEAIAAGALGYLLKDESLGAVVQAIIQVVEYGGAPMSPRIARKALQMLTKSRQSATVPPSEVAPELSTRETEILKALVNGLDYKAIAELLFISPHTVRKHIANIYEKLHVTNRAQAVGLALRKRWF